MKISSKESRISAGCLIFYIDIESFLQNGLMVSENITLINNEFFPKESNL